MIECSNRVLSMIDMENNLQSINIVTDKQYTSMVIMYLP